VLFLQGGKKRKKKGFALHKERFFCKHSFLRKFKVSGGKNPAGLAKKKKKKKA